MNEELNQFLKSQNIKIISILKEHNFSVGKGNYIVELSDQKFLLKVFSGFKRKYLRNEINIRDILVKNNFPNVSTGFLNETDTFTYLFIPYIENQGNLVGKEVAFIEDILNLIEKFHSLPINDFKNFRTYHLFVNDSFNKNKYPYTYGILTSMDLATIRTYFDNLRKSYGSYGLIVSHNDFDGDNLLLSKSGDLILTDFEKCSLNNPLEDLSKLYFFNSILSGIFCEDNLLYQHFINLPWVKKNDFDAFVLYQAVRFNEFTNAHKEDLNHCGSIKKAQENFIELIRSYSKSS